MFVCAPHQDCNDALVKIRLAFRHIQPELPADAATAAAAAVTMAPRCGGADGFDGMDHEVELLILQGAGGGYGFIASAPSGGHGMMMAMSDGGALPASSEGALDMMEVGGS